MGNNGLRQRGMKTALVVALPVLAGGAFWLFASRGPAQPDRQAPDGLLRMLEGSEEDAANAQAEMERRYGIEDIGKWRAALDSSRARARSLAVESVGKRKSPEVVHILTAALEDPDSEVRINAVQALASEDPSLALRPMLAAIKDEDTWVSEHAANKIRELRSKEAVPVLIDALRNPDRETGVFAAGALKHLTGQPIRAGKTDSTEQWNAAVARWDRWWAGARAHWPASPGANEVQPIQPTRSFAAPDFTLKDANGNTLSLKELRGKMVLLNFWGRLCGPCEAEMPGLNAVASEHANKELVVIGVECNGADPTILRQYAVEHNIGFALAPGTEAIQEAYGHIHDVPVSFLIDRDGRIRYQ